MSAYHQAGALLPAYALASMLVRRRRAASNLRQTRDSALSPVQADTERLRARRHRWPGGWTRAPIIPISGRIASAGGEVVQGFGKGGAVGGCPGAGRPRLIIDAAPAWGARLRLRAARVSAW
jgi:hypothetical protein